MDDHWASGEQGLADWSAFRRRQSTEIGQELAASGRQCFHRNECKSIETEDQCTTGPIFQA